MNAKNTKKSPIHENADANITCDFGDISRFMSRLPHTWFSSIIVRLRFGGIRVSFWVMVEFISFIVK